MNRFKAFVIIACLFIPIHGFAQTLPMSDELTFSRFHADLTVLPSGELDVVETITGVFLLERRGIYRFVPREYSVEDGVIAFLPFAFIGAKDESGDVMAIDYMESPNAVIRIGNPDITRIGPFTYQIHYRMKGVFFYEEEKDSLFWQVTGTEWPDYFEQVSASVRLPEGAILLDQECMTGYFHEKDLVCTVSQEGQAIQFQSSGVMTLMIGFTPRLIQQTEPEIVDLRAYEMQETDMRQYLRQMQVRKGQTIIGLSIGLVAILIGLVLYRIFDARKWKTGGPIVTQFEAPQGLKPLELGFVWRGRLRRADYVALLIDFAVRGLVRIETNDTGFKVVKLTSLQQDWLPYERVFFTALFPDDKIVSRNEEEIGKAIAHSIEDIEWHIREHLVSRNVFKGGINKGFYSELQKAQKFNLVVIAVYGLLSWHYQHILPIASAIAFAFLVQLVLGGATRLSKNGQILRREIAGFREFIYSAERYRVQWQEKERVFDEVLPYAMVFDLAKTWQETFAQRPESVRGTTQFEWLAIASDASATERIFAKSLQHLERQIIQRTKKEQSRLRQKSSSSYKYSSRSSSNRSSTRSSLPRGGSSGKSGGFGGGGGGAW